MRVFADPLISQVDLILSCWKENPYNRVRLTAGAVLKNSIRHNEAVRDVFISGLSHVFFRIYSDNLLMLKLFVVIILIGRAVA
jgi:hypothetical protein